MISEEIDIIDPADYEEEEEQQGLFEHFRFNVDRGQSLIRIDKYITVHLENTSRNRVQLAIDEGYVMVNGTVVKASYKVKPLDIITIMLPYKRKSSEIIPEDIPLQIRYEDNDLMVINKPAGMVVHPGHGNYSGTLVNALAHYLKLDVTEIPDDESDERMGVLVHRIDKNTSGLLLIAKREESQFRLAKQFFDHTIERKYIAIVWGDIKDDEGTIIGNIGRDPNDRLRFKVFQEGDQGKHAVTHYKVLERLGYVTVVECKLETGRTHQIRVHMNYIGHPLFNDDRYGGDKILKGTLYSKYKQFIDNCFETLPRHALHARILGFIHPVTGEALHFEEPLPEDMTALIQKWRKYRQ